MKAAAEFEGRASCEAQYLYNWCEELKAMRDRRSRGPPPRGRTVAWIHAGEGKGRGRETAKTGRKESGVERPSPSLERRRTDDDDSAPFFFPLLFRHNSPCAAEAGRMNEKPRCRSRPSLRSKAAGEGKELVFPSRRYLPFSVKG